MNEALLQTLMRLVTGKELPKLCPNCGAPAANYALDGAAVPNSTNVIGPQTVELWVGCDSCSETLRTFSLDDLLGAFNNTL